MNTRDIATVLDTLFTELVDGASGGGAYMLNSGDVGLLGSLDRLSAEDASHATAGGATIAAHVDHLRYGLSLMNRWSRGEYPFKHAEWGASWRITSVSEARWHASRDALRQEVHAWREAMKVPRNVNDAELNGIIGSIAHLAYHLGAIRQISAAARGPREGTNA